MVLQNPVSQIRTIALATTNQMDTGIRAVSAVLKPKYNVVKMKLYEDGRHGKGANYSDDEVGAILNTLSELSVDLLGISLFEFGAKRAFTLVRAVKEKLGIPVIMGGQYAMQWPDECLTQGADAVCLSESEFGFLELLENWDKRFEYQTPNFVVTQADLVNVHGNRARLLTEPEIDQLIPDFSDAYYFTLESGEMVPMIAETTANPEHHQTDRDLRTFVYASDRGCPFNCSFCYVPNMRKLTLLAAKAQEVKPVPFLRRKSPWAMVRDMRIIKESNPWVEHLTLMNDDTAARTLEEMQEFSRLYRRDIGWPFYCMVSPMSLWDKDKAGTPEEVVEGRGKIQALVDAGLTELNAGIQTNGETNFRDYGRLQRDEVLFPVTDMLNEFAKDGKIGLFYDFITFNPRESSEDTRRTLKLIQRLKPPFDLVSHTLHIGQRSKMRDWYERYKAEEIANGRSYNKVHEDLVGESDYHDTYLFYDHLADNPNFSLSALIEFLAGLHNQEMTGRIPRYAQDLMGFDVFKDLRVKHDAFAQILDRIGIPSGMLSMELLALERIEEFFRENRFIFKELYLNLHAQHPIHYSNMRKK